MNSREVAVGRATAPASRTHSERLARIGSGGVLDREAFGVRPALPAFCTPRNGTGRALRFIDSTCAIWFGNSLSAACFALIRRRCASESHRPTQLCSMPRLHADRIARSYCCHRCSGGVAFAGGAGEPGKSPAGPMRGQFARARLAALMYWDDADGVTFRYQAGATNGGKIYWFGWLKPGPEGTREFDPAAGALYPYLQGRGVEVCPSMDYSSTLYKYKLEGAATSYGYNFYLGKKSHQYQPHRASK